MGFIFSGQKEEDQWVDLQLHLKKMRKEQFLQALLIRASFLFVTGLLVQLMKLEVKMIQLLVIGIKKEAIGQLLLLIYYLPMRTSF